MYKLSCYFIFILTIFSLSACAGNTGGGGGSTTASSLNLDQVSTIPLINNQAQSFYVYATNTGTTT